MVQFRLVAGETVNDFKKFSKEFPYATSVALTKVATQAMNESISRIISKYNLTQKEVKTDLKVSNAKPNYQRAVITGWGKGISLRRFDAKQTKKPTKKTPSGKARNVVTAKVIKSKGRLVVPQAFMTITVFRRKGLSRLPIEKLYGPGLATLFGVKEMNIAERYVLANFERILQSQISYWLK